MFKFTAIIRLSEDGNYEITFPAIKVLKDVKSISLNTEDVEEIIITKIVVFVDETGMLRA